MKRWRWQRQRVCRSRRCGGFPERLPEIEYPTGFVRRKVGLHGDINRRVGKFFLGEVLSGETVGASGSVRCRWLGSMRGKSTTRKPSATQTARDAGRRHSWTALVALRAPTAAQKQLTGRLALPPINTPKLLPISLGVHRVGRLLRQGASEGGALGGAWTVKGNRPLRRLAGSCAPKGQNPRKRARLRRRGGGSSAIAVIVSARTGGHHYVRMST